MLRKILNIAYIVFFTQILYANESRILRLSNNDGLSNSSITTIFQDSNGLIWVGTWDGLNVYNGAEFENYRSNRQDSSSITNPVIRQIFEENKNIEDLLNLKRYRSLNLIKSRDGCKGCTFLCSGVK